VILQALQEDSHKLPADEQEAGRATPVKNQFQASFCMQNWVDTATNEDSTFSREGPEFNKEFPEHLEQGGCHTFGKGNYGQVTIHNWDP
jgi:hypothetical protein